MSRATAFAGVITTAALGVIAACGGDQARVPAPARPLPASTCGPITYGGQGKPQLIIANSGSLQGPFSDHGIQNAQAAKLVLAKRGWRAGRFTVGLQVCDEADAASSVPTEVKCRRNARQFARNSSVIAVLGPITSACARAMIRTLNRARGGPLAVVSMSSTYLGLTRKGPGVAPGDPQRLYPKGVRNYVRMVPADDAQAAAGAIYASARGVRRPYILHHDQAWGVGLATAFRTTARRIGMTIAGIGRWDRRAEGYSRLAERIRRSRADAVYVAGYATENGARLVRDLRARLGSNALIIGPDGFNMPARLVEEAGASAEGLVTTLASLPVRALPPNGRRFAREFERRFGALPCCYAMQTAQGAYVILDAIAGSDGTRASVLRRIFGTRVREGLVGSFTLDRYGDPTLRHVGVYVIRDARSRYVTAIAPSEGLLARQ